MKTKELSRIVSGHLLELGLTEISRPYNTPIFAKAGTDVCPYFSPHILRRHGGSQILGNVGVYIPRFEQWWQYMLEEVYKKKKIHDDSLFALHISNIARFHSPEIVVSTNDIPVVTDWLNSIFDITKTLPDNYARLEQAAKGDKLVDQFSLKHFYCHPVKVYAFRKWCGSNLPELSHLIDVREPLARLNPFEEIFLEVRRVV